MGEGPLETLVFRHTEFIDLFQQKSSHVVLPFLSILKRNGLFVWRSHVLFALLWTGDASLKPLFWALKSRNYNRELPQPWRKKAKKKMTGILSIEAISFDMSKVSKIFHQDPSKIQQTSFLVIQKFELPPPKENTEFHMFPSRIYPIFVHQIQVLHCAPNGHRPCHLHKWMRCRKKKHFDFGVRFDLIFLEEFHRFVFCGKRLRKTSAACYAWHSQNAVSLTRKVACCNAIKYVCLSAC